MGLVFFCETYQEILFALVWKVFQDYVLLFLNSYYFFSFILESGCFCSKWLLKFIVNCLHHFFFFCIKAQVPPDHWNPKVFNILFFWSTLQPSHTSAYSVVRDDTLSVLPKWSFTPLPKGSGNSWFHHGSLWDNTKPPQRRKSYHYCYWLILSPILGKQQWKPLHSALLQGTFAAAGMEKALP